MLPLPRGKRRRRCECEGAMAGERDGRQMDRCRLKLGEESHQDCGSPRQAAGSRTYSGPGRGVFQSSGMHALFVAMPVFPTIMADVNTLPSLGGWSERVTGGRKGDFPMFCFVRIWKTG